MVIFTKLVFINNNVYLPIIVDIEVWGRMVKDDKFSAFKYY